MKMGEIYLVQGTRIDMRVRLMVREYSLCGLSGLGDKVHGRRENFRGY